MADDYIIRDLQSLRAIYGEPSGGAVAKEVDYLHPHYQALIRAAPFAVLATAGERFVDATPRGDGPGFVTIEDEHTLLLPDRRGNNRVDGLRNILHDPRVALLFLVPGVSETLRVNGRAEISIEPGLLERFIHAGKLPRPGAFRPQVGTCQWPVSVISVEANCRSEAGQSPAGTDERPPLASCRSTRQALVLWKQRSACIVVHLGLERVA